MPPIASPIGFRSIDTDPRADTVISKLDGTVIDELLLRVREALAEKELAYAVQRTQAEPG